MPKLRFKFGPMIVGPFPRPEVPGELPDVDVTASVKSYRAGKPGEIELDVAFEVPPFDPATSQPIVQFHALSFSANHGLPLDPELALASDAPKASVLPPPGFTGGELVCTIKGSPIGQLKIPTVLVYEEADPAPIAPEPVSAS